MSVLASIGDTAFKIIFNSLTWIMIGLAAVGIFFASKYIARWNKKRKSYKLHALIIKPDGNWYTDLLGLFDHPDHIDKLHFKNMGWTMPIIPSHLVRANQVILYNYGPKQFAVIPPRIWENIDLKNFKIELINTQAKNFAFLEQRAAVSRWAYIKDLMTKMAPWIALVLIVACAGVAVWFLMKLGTDIYGQVVSARIAECKQVLPSLPSVVNSAPPG